MANYSLTKNIHSLSVLAGVSYEHYQEETLMASRQDFPADSFSDLSQVRLLGHCIKMVLVCKNIKCFLILDVSIIR